MNLAQMEQRAHLLKQAKPRTYTPITDVSVWDDVGILAGVEVANWRQRFADLHASGVPTALDGGVAGAEAKPLPDALGAVTLAVAEAALWPAATWTPIAANFRAPVQYELFASGQITTTATASPTITFVPRFGTTTGGGALGATPAITLTASQTATPWQIRGELTIRATGTGTNARAYGTFTLIGKFVTPANGIVDAHHIFGYTAATGDSTAAQGLFIGVLSTITTPTITPQQIKWGSWN